MTAVGAPRLLACGPRAVLVECGAERTVAVCDALRGLPGVVHLVPAAETVLVEHDGSAGVEASIGDALLSCGRLDDAATGGALVEIEVRYDGDDLADVAAACGLTVPDVVALHSAAEFTSAFCGFAPGFAYLSGLAEPLAQVPRRATPRTRVPAGSVAIAGGYSAVYPSASPGGWQLLGHTSAMLWDPTAAQPALLVPGTRVRFVAVDG